LVAYFIDAVLMSPVLGVFMAYDPSAFMKLPAPGPSLLSNLPQPTPLAFAVTIVIGVIYNALFETSSWQATPGKRILKLYVTDMNGRRITLARAAGRNLPKMILSAVFPLPHALAGFTEKKQALHDILAGCLVVRRP
jgi:uncharacterized RDD family membrane protein YckC